MRQQKIQSVAKKALGGEIAQYTPLVSGAANALLPGSGAIIDPLLNIMTSFIDSKVGDNRMKLKLSTARYALGGKLEGKLGPGMAQYDGREHKVGGIMITKSGTPSSIATEDNVEHEEVLVNLGKLGTHIFSKRLKIQ